MKKTLVFIIALWPIFSFAQTIPYTVDLLDVHKTPVPFKHLEQTLETPNGIYLRYGFGSQNTSNTVSFFDRDTLAHLQTSGPLTLIGATESGVFALDEIIGGSSLRKVPIFIPKNGDSFNQLTDIAPANPKAYFLNDKILVFSSDQGVRSYSQTGEEVVLRESFDNCNCTNRYFRFEDLLVYNNTTDYIITDGTPAGTKVLFEGQGNLSAYNSLIFRQDVDLLMVYDPVSGLTTSLTEGLPSIPGGTLSEPSNLVVTPDGILFIARTLAGGKELFLTDGTKAGTRGLAQINPGSEDGVGLFEAAKEAIPYLIFRRGPESMSNEYWLSDGSDAGTYPIITIEDQNFLSNAVIRASRLPNGKLFIVFHNQAPVPGTSLLYSLDPSQPQQPAALLDTLPFNLHGQALRTVNNRLLVGGSLTEGRLLSYGTSPGDVVSVGQIGALANDRFLTDSLFFIQRPSPTSEVDTIYLTKGLADDLLPLVPTLNNPRGALSGGAIFTAGGNFYAHTFDPELGEAIYSIDEQNGTSKLVTDVFPPNTGATTSSLQNLSGTLYWVAEEEGESSAKYLSDGTEIGSGRISGLAGFDLSDRPVGNLRDRYYFTKNFEGDKLVEINTRTGAVKDLSGVIEDNDDFTYGGFQFLGDKIYSRRAVLLSNPERWVITLMEIDPIATTLTAVTTDTFLVAEQRQRSLILVADDRFLYFSAPQEGGVGPVVFDPVTRSRVALGAVPTDRYLIYFRIGDRVFVKDQAFSALNGGFFLSPTEIGPQIGIDLNWDKSVILNGGLVTLSINGTPYSVDYATGAATPLADRGEHQLGASSLTKINSQEAVFFRQAQDFTWEIWKTDGSVTGTAKLAAFPERTSVPPQEVVAFQDHLGILLTAPSRLFLFDLRTSASQQIAVDLPVEAPEPGLAVIGNRLYFAGVDSELGEEIHYLTITDLPVVSGRVFLDRNGDGEQDEEEEGLSNFSAQLTGGNLDRSFTDTDGTFRFPALEGQDYRVEMAEEDCYELTTAPSAYTFTFSPDSSYQLRFGLRRITGDPNVDVTLYSGPIRCGFAVPFWLTIRNNGCDSLGGMVSLDLGENVVFTESEQPPDAIDGRVYRWDYPGLLPGQIHQIRLMLTMPDQTFNDQVIPLMAIAKSSDLLDTFRYDQRLRCAIDPNDKLVSPSRPEISNSNYTLFDEWLTYTIRFQNTGTDTAFNVRIEDQLPAELDFATFHPLASSAPYRTVIDKTGRVVFHFDNIMLPDSNVNEPASHGFVTFEIQAEAGQDDFTLAQNNAGIYFDFNAPVITNTVSSTFVKTLDADEDGFFFYEECDDNNPGINPLAEEVANNEIDENCDGRDGTVSTSEPLTGQLRAFPNPTTNELTLTYDQTDWLQGSIYNAQGRMVRPFNFNGQTTLELTALPPGLYSFHLWEPASGRSSVLRIIKQ